MRIKILLLLVIFTVPATAAEPGKVPIEMGEFGNDFKFVLEQHAKAGWPYAQDDGPVVEDGNFARRAYQDCLKEYRQDAFDIRRKRDAGRKYNHFPIRSHGVHVAGWLRFSRWQRERGSCEYGGEPKLIDWQFTLLTRYASAYTTSRPVPATYGRCGWFLCAASPTPVA